MKSIAEQAKDLEQNPKEMIEFIIQKYVGYVRLKDGRERFQFADDSFIDLFR